MSTVSEPVVVRSRPSPRLVLPPVPPPVKARAPYWFRLSWLLGLVLLTGSLVGASHVLQSRQTDPSANPKSPTTTQPAAHGVVCLGTVAIDGGVPPDGVPLAPMQQGEVIEMAGEGLSYKQGDILLRVDDERFRNAVAQAESGLRLAEVQVAKARRGLEQFRHIIDAQRAAIEAARHKQDSAEIELRRARFLKDQLGQSNNDDIAAKEELFKAAKAGLDAEDANLRAREASRPDLEVEEAQANVELAKQRLQQARIALDSCVLRAKTDGSVLRINVTKGALVTSQMRQAPILFAPANPRIVRVEVPQEFAHRVQAGMTALVHDVANADLIWQGTVKRMTDAYLPRRTASTEMISVGGNEAWVLECIVELAPTQAPPRMGQRVRVGIGTQRSP